MYGQQPSDDWGRPGKTKRDTIVQTNATLRPRRCEILVIVDANEEKPFSLCGQYGPANKLFRVAKFSSRRDSAGADSNAGELCSLHR